MTGEAVVGLIVMNIKLMDMGGILIQLVFINKL